MPATDSGRSLDYFEHGLSFLPYNHWTSLYDLSLTVHVKTLDAAFAEGKHDKVTEVVNLVLLNAMNFNDKFHSYTQLIRSTAIQGSADVAIAEIGKLLTSLGDVPINSDVSLQSFVQEIMSVRRLLAGRQKELLFANPSHMNDQTLVMTMKLKIMLVIFYTQQQSYMSGIVVCNMIRQVLQFGLCEEGVIALAFFSNLVLERIDDVEEACQLGRLSVSLIKHFDEERLIPGVYCIVYGTVLLCQDPWHSLMEPLLTACRTSFATSNFEFATLNAMAFVGRSWNGGRHIGLIMSEMRNFGQVRGHAPCACSIQTHTCFSTSPIGKVLRS